MTIVVGLIADDGLVIASDSQISVGSIRRPSQKVWNVTDGSFCFGLAGAESTMHELRDTLLRLNLSDMATSDIAATLTEVGFRTLQPIYDRQRQMGVTNPSEWPLAEFVVGAWSQGSPQLFHCDSLARVPHHGRGFVSAAAGGPLGEHAITVYRHLRSGVMSLHQAKMLAYRVLMDAIEAGGPSLGIGGQFKWPRFLEAAASIPLNCWYETIRRRATL